MKKQKKNQKGITLIALIITIIILLILAGVSLNAIIGENGIISNALEAKIKTDIAVLEEFLQEQYIEICDEVESEDNKIISLINNPDTKKYFYKPTVGALQYIIDSEGHALYLINKDGLPNEIKNSLTGGDAGNKEYMDYANLSDVYGVTTDLKVYYCSNGLDTILGLSKEDLDVDNPERVVFSEDNPLAKLITGNEGESVTADEIKSVKDLEINGNTITSLTDLYNLTSLQKLKLINYNGSLAGLENAMQLSEILIENSNIIDYSPIGKMGKNLKKLYFYNVTDEEINKLCSKTSTGIGNYDLPNLKYFGIMGNLIVESTSFNTSGNGYLGSDQKCEHLITNVNSLANLSKVTKEAVENLYLNDNIIKNFIGLEGFTKVKLIRAEYNELVSFQGLENMKELTSLMAHSNLIGSNEVYNTESENNGRNESTDALSFLKNCKKISYLNIENNKIRWTQYLNNITGLKELYLQNNTALVDVPEIKTIIFACTKYTIDTKYSLDLLDEKITTKLDLTNYTLTYSNLDSIKKCSKLVELKIDGIKLEDNNENLVNDANTFNEKLNEFLSDMPQMKYLSMSNISNLKTISFISKMNNIIELWIVGTGVTDLTALNSKTTLRSLGIDNVSIDLTTIQQTISRLNDEAQYHWHGRTSGLYIPKIELLTKLKDCTEITNLCFYYHDNLTGNGESLDLSNCTSLKTITLCRLLLNIKLPSSLERIRAWDYTSYFPDLSKCINLQVIDQMCLDHTDTMTEESVKKMIDSMVVCTKMTHLNFYRVNAVRSLTVFENLRNCQNFKKLTLGGYNYSHNKTLATLEGLDNLPFLEEITINYCDNLKDLSFLSRLTNLKTININYISKFTTIPDLSASANSLKTVTISNCGTVDILGLYGLNLNSLNLSNNNVTSLYSLRSMRQLSYLNLENNALYDTFSYRDEQDVLKTGNNIDILADLNLNGILKKLYISGNQGITNTSKLKELSWTESSGF